MNKFTEYPGLDYSGRDATCNRDVSTGIRYGIISSNKLNECWCESAEPKYTARCPECGEACVDFDHVKHENEEVYAEHKTRGSCQDYVCECCKLVYDSMYVFGEEPDSINLDNLDYTAFEDSHGDVWVVHSPFFTYAQFCSPCAPGAVYLSNPLLSESKDNRGYCFDKSWFDDEACPYPYYSVKTGELIYTPKRKPTDE